jgi:hypothetical protein
VSTALPLERAKGIEPGLGWPCQGWHHDVTEQREAALGLRVRAGDRLDGLGNEHVIFGVGQGADATWPSDASSRSRAGVPASEELVKEAMDIPQSVLDGDPAHAEQQPHYGSGAGHRP